MGLIKKISALLAAVMAFSFVGLSINSNDVAAAGGPQVSIPAEDVFQYNKNSCAGYAAGVWAYNIGKAKSFDFIVNNSGEQYTIKAIRWSVFAYIHEEVNILNPETVTTDKTKIKVDQTCVYDVTNSEGYFNTGIYEFTFTNNSNESTTIRFYVTGNEEGAFSGVYEGQTTGYTLLSGPGSFDAEGHTERYGTPQPQSTIGITNMIQCTIDDTEYMPVTRRFHSYRIEYWDNQTPTHIGSPVIFEMPRTDMATFSLTTSILDSSASCVDSYGNFQPGYYRFTVDGAAFAWIRVTGNANDGVYPDGNPATVGAAGFVERCYTKCLGRASDPDGKAYWISCLTRAFDGCDVAKEFFFSDEFVGMNLSDDEYVERLYQTFMDRSSDRAGKAFWLNCLANGSSRLDILYGFCNSPEWRDLCAEYGIRPGGSVLPTISIQANYQTVAFVGRLYTVALGRDPEADGTKTWAENLFAGRTTATAVTSSFLLGTEFRNRNVSNQEFLTILYRVYMDRPVEYTEEGYQYWLGLLNNNSVSRAAVVQSFASSSEFAQVCANAGINV